MRVRLDRQGLWIGYARRALAPLACAALVMAAAAASDLTAPAQKKVTAAQFAVAFLKDPQGGGMYRQLKKYQPEKFQALVEELATRKNAGATDAELFEISRVRAADIRLEFAKYFQTAPDAMLRNVIASYRELLLAMKDKTRLCNSVALQGGGVLTQEIATQYLPVLTKLAEVQMQAAFEGALSPTERAVATGQDWAEMRAIWAQKPNGKAEMAAVAAQDVEKALTCEAMISFLSVIETAEGAVAERVRAAFATSAAAN